MRKSEKIEIQLKIGENINNFSNGLIDFNKCISRTMIEIELVYHRAREEAFKEIVIDLKKLNKEG